MQSAAAVNVAIPVQVMPDEALLAKADCFVGDKSALVLAESFLLQVAVSRRLADKAEGLLFMDSFKVRSQGHPCMRCRQTQHACSEAGIQCTLAAVPGATCSGTLALH